jgi:sulfite exporter TauE/SafE
MEGLATSPTQWGLIWSLCSTAAVLGLLSAWHCAAMCAPLLMAGLGGCAGGPRGTRSARAMVWWAVGRGFSYAVVGAAAASVWGLLGDWMRGDAGGDAVAMARQFVSTAWTWTHAGILAWGLALLATGRTLGLTAWAGPPRTRPRGVVWMISGAYASSNAVDSYKKNSKEGGGSACAGAATCAVPLPPSAALAAGSRHPAAAQSTLGGSWRAHVGWLWGLMPCPTLRTA